MTSRLFKILSIGIASLLIFACSHPIEIVGQGDVTSASGNRNCSLENYQATDTHCTKNYAIGAYTETYYATPRAGWQFDHWVNYCATAAPPNYDCSFNIPAATVYQFWGQTMPPLRAVFTSTCTHGTANCPWVAGDVTTRTQNLWDDDATTGNILATNFSAVYPSLEVVIGIDDGNLSHFSMVFESATAILEFLIEAAPPASGPLNQNHLNPINTEAGQFGGEVLALRLNIDFASQLGGAYSFGELRICGLDPALGAINGLTVDQYMTAVNTALGGGAALYTFIFLENVAIELNEAFIGGVASTFANDHLVAGTCPQ